MIMLVVWRNKDDKLKELSHEMDLAFDDIYGEGTGPVFKFFYLLKWFYNLKSVYFSQLMRVYFGLIMLSAGS